jgi:outer membrane protein assembly factor BamB
MIRNVSGVFCLLATLVLGRGQEVNWPQFRGPRGDGTTLNAPLPFHWSETQNVKWKTPIHGRAWSSPVIWGSQVWLTTATEDGTQLFAVCVDRESGKILHDLKLFEIEKPQFAHKFNTYGSPTPVIEAGRVYVTFGSPGTACLDTQSGRKLWERRDFICNHYRGAGSSPILHSNLFIVNFDGSDRQYVVALDKLTGRTAWERKRSIDFQDLDTDGQPMTEGDLRKAFATCHVAALEGVPTLLSQGAKAMYAYDPLTGEEFWRVEERQNHSGSARPVAGEGLVFVASGWANGQVLAIRPGRKGEVVDANSPTNLTSQLQVVWKSKRNTPKKPSLLLKDGLLFGIDDNGVATCWDARTGATLWNERVGGNHSSSPILGAGRVYFFSEEGRSVVIEAGRQFKKLAENTLDGGFMASPAVTGSALILRTKTHLYRIQE